MAIIQGSRSPIPRQGVTIASSLDGAPMLDFSHFTDPFSLDDADKPALPRTKSSNDILSTAMAMREPSDDGRTSLDSRRDRILARDDGERPSMGHLIQFLRTVSPPPQNYLPPSTFEDDEGETVDAVNKWKTLRNKFRLRLARNNSSSASSDEVPTKVRLPDTAVASKTSGGHTHIAISIPVEHCHLGPDSQWSVAAYNATKPLPPSPPIDPLDRIMTAPGHQQSQGHDTSILGAPKSAREHRDWLYSSSDKSSLSLLQHRDSESTIRQWARHPLSPPHSPPVSSPDADGRPSTTPSQSSKLSMPLPMDPKDFVECQDFSMGHSKKQSVEERLRQIHVSWMTTNNILESAGGPPRPESSPRKASVSSNDSQRTKLPTRNSSLRAPVKFYHAPRNQPSMDQLPEKPWQQPELRSSESFFEGFRIDGSETVGGSPRTIKIHMTASEGLKATTSELPDLPMQLPPLRYSRPLMDSVESPSEPASPEQMTARKASTRTNASRMSRKERVRSLKQRDMEAARKVFRELERPHVDRANSASPVARPETAETVISTLRLPSREGPVVSDLAGKFPRPPTAASDTADTIPDLRLDTANVSRPGSGTTAVDESQCFILADPSLSLRADQGQDLFRFGDLATARSSLMDDTSTSDSTTTSRLPLRFNSLTRTSWASSIPLLDRFSSYEPSESSFMQVLGSVETHSSPHRRSDSATLPQLEQERLTPSRLSYVASSEQPDETLSSQHPEEFPGRRRRICPSSSAPRLQPIPRLSAIMPVANVQPSSQGADANATLTSPTLTSPTLTFPTIYSPTSIPQYSPPGSPDEGTMTPSTGRQHSLSESSQPCSTHTRDTSVATTKQAAAGYELLHPRGWIPRSNSETSYLGEESARLDSLIQQHSSSALMRLSSEPRAADLAHHILINQKRLELDIRRQEHNQIVFLSQLENALEDLRRKIPTTEQARESFGWDDERMHPVQPCEPGDFEHRRISVEKGRLARATDSAASPDHARNQSQCRGPRRLWLVDGIGDDDKEGSVSDIKRLSRGQPDSRQHRKQSYPRSRISTVKDIGLDSMEPLMRELQDTSRVSLESPGRQRQASSSSVATRGKGVGGGYYDMF